MRNIVVAKLINHKARLGCSNVNLNQFLIILRRNLMITYKVNEYGCGNAMHPILDYTLTEVEKGLVFQIHNQSPLITNFLRKNKFQASNGLTIDISEYPEYKESKLTVYLRGNNGFYNTKPDVTGFYSNLVRDNRKAMINAALKELVGYVKKLNAWNPWVVPGLCAFQPQFTPRPKDYICFEV